MMSSCTTMRSSSCPHPNHQIYKLHFPCIIFLELLLAAILNKFCTSFSMNHFCAPLWCTFSNFLELLLVAILNKSKTFFPTFPFHHLFSEPPFCSLLSTFLNFLQFLLVAILNKLKPRPCAYDIKGVSHMSISPTPLHACSPCLCLFSQTFVGGRLE